MANSVASQSANAASEHDQPAPMASWSGQGVGIGQVDVALLALRRGEERAATRVSTINLVVVAEDSADAERASAVMRRLGGRSPGRTVLLIPDCDGDPNIDADVRLYHSTVGARPVWWEEIRIRVAGPVCDHLDSLVEPLTLGDLPVTVWYASSIPDPAEPLVGAADVVVVESPTGAGPGGRPHRRPLARRARVDETVGGAFSLLLDVSQRRPLVDLSWLRLTPWRRLFAAIFDVSEFRSFAARIDRAEVTARPGAALLLAGWLADRLELPHSAITRRSASDAAIELVASGHRGGGRFSVAAGEGEDVVTAVAEIEGGVRHRDAVQLPADPLAATLAEALTCVGHDRIYERAVGAALDIDR
jgi:glucose-6-phosphate dehydrogenase assembly protein OpcA